MIQDKMDRKSKNDRDEKCVQDIATKLRGKKRMRNVCKESSGKISAVVVGGECADSVHVFQDMA
jgi:hypothetical protein